MFTFYILCIFLCFLWWTRWLWRAIVVCRGVPTLSGGYPLIGHANNFLLQDNVNIFEFIKNTSKELVEREVLSDLKELDQFLNSSLKKNYIYQFGKAWIGNGLITATSPDHWRTHRKMLNPAFHQNTLVGYLTVFNKESRRLIDELLPYVGTGPFEHGPIIGLNFLESICQTLFGLPPKDTDYVDKQYRNGAEKILEIMMERFRNVWMHPDFLYYLLPSANRKEEIEVVKTLHKMSSELMNDAEVRLCQKVIYALIGQIKKGVASTADGRGGTFSPVLSIQVLQRARGKSEEKYKQESGPKFKSVLDLLLEHQSQGLLQDCEVREELDTLIMAGHDTTATTLMFAATLLGSHPEVQDKAYAELIEVVGDTDRDITKEDIPKLVYMEAVLKETMRLYPVVPLIMRELDKDVKIKNYTVPSGTTVMVPIWGVNRDKSWGDDVEEFRPERWLDSSSLPDKPGYAAFSFGKRSCIGKQYAIMSMKTTLSHLCRRYRLEASKEDMKLKYEVFLKPASKLLMSLELRKK